MTRHPLRWRGLAFGLFFLAIAGNWAVWKQDLLTPQQFSYSVSAVLIALGVIGVVGTFWNPGGRQTTSHALIDSPANTPEENHEAPDPQP